MYKALEILRANFEARQAKVDELRQLDEAAKNRVFTDDEKTKVTELRSELAELDGRISAGLNTEVRSKEINDATAELLGHAKNPGSGSGGDWGAQVVRALTTDGIEERSVLASSGTIPVTVPLSSVPVVDGRRARFLSELIPMEEAEAGHYSYLRQTVRTNNAAPVADGEVKPTSVYTLERVDDQTQVIAHLSESIPRRHLEDAELLSRFVEDEMRYGLDLAVDGQIIGGNGTAPNLPGIGQAGIQTQAFDTDIFTTTRKAVTALEVVDLAPSAWVFHPNDWETVELLADVDERLQMQPEGPVNRAERRLWGTTVFVSSVATPGTAILGDFAGSSKLWGTGPVRLDWFEGSVNDGTSDFERNLIKLRAERRVGFGVLRPDGFVSVALSAP